MTLINKLMWFPLSPNYTESPWSPQSPQLSPEGLQPSCTEPIVSAPHNSQQLGDKAGVVWKKQQINEALAADSIQTLSYLQEFKEEIKENILERLTFLQWQSQAGDLLGWDPNPWDCLSWG